MTYDVPFLRHVTSILFLFSCFLNSSILYRLISKLAHALIGPILCTIQKCIDQHDVIYVSMATRYPIIKHRFFFFKTSTFFNSVNNEDIDEKFDHTLML